jgi:hypothetical protein
MVLDWAGDKTDPMAFSHDLWAHELCATLRATGDLFREPGRTSPARPSELAATGAFEVASPNGVAIWYGGFIESEARLDAILAWLDGDADAVLAGIPSIG